MSFNNNNKYYGNYRQ